MPEFVRIESPFEDKPSRQELREQLRDHVVRGIVKVKDETFTYISGTNTYTLDHSPYSPTSNNFEIEGTYNTEPRVFIFGTDYTISGRTITWNTSETVPDNNTTFYVDYTYQGTLSGIRDEDPASLVMIELEACGNALDDIYDDLKRTYYSAYVETATGNDLEKVAALVGATRTSAGKSSGTLKLIFSQAATIVDPVVVPAENRFSTRSTTSEEPIYFKTPTGSTFNTGQTYGYIGIEALVGGKNGNVGNSTINVIVDSITNVESCTNPSALSGGTDKEDDDDFRDRIPLAKESKGKSTANALIFDLNNIPGVSSVKPKNNWFATAHSALFVTPETFPASSSLQQKVDDAINSGVAFGCKITALYPKVINAWMTVDVERTSASDSGALFNTISGNAWNYFEGLGLGDRFIQQQFTKEILSPVDIVRVKSFTISETGNTDLYINTDQVMRMGYRVNTTGNSLGVFNEGEVIPCTGDYSTGWVSAIGIDTIESGLSVFATHVYKINAVYLNDSTLCNEGSDYRLYSSGYPSGDAFYNTSRISAIEWLSGATNYPLSGDDYSVLYQYNAFQANMTSTGEF
nr:MAG: baseplate J [Lokiarchaeota virus Ratatoskr Meg22_1012]